MQHGASSVWARSPMHEHKDMQAIGSSGSCMHAAAPLVEHAPSDADTCTHLTACSHVLCVGQVGQYGGLAQELENLKRDKNVLMAELIRLRQQQQVLARRPGSVQVAQ